MEEQKKWKGFCPEVIVPGCELNPEEDVKNFHSLFLNAGHSVPPRHPLFAYYATKYWAHGMKYVPSWLHCPNYRGYEWRHYKGAMYAACIIIRDEEEIQRREKEFEKSWSILLKDFGEIWEERKKELMEGFEEIKSFDMDNAKPNEIVFWLYRNRMIIARMWEIHFSVLSPCHMAVVLLGERLKEYGMPHTSPEFQKLMRGHDNKPFQIHEQLWKFGERARKEGLANIFKENDSKEILPKLKETEAGRKWLDDFMKFLEVEGWWPTVLMEFTAPYWLEDPSIPLGIIRQNLKKEVEYNLPKIRERLARERDETIAKILEKVPDGDKDYIEKVIKVATLASKISEEHDIYCEYHHHAAIRYQYLRLARKLVKAGTMDEPEDIFYLTPEEIEPLVMVPEANDCRLLIKERRRLYEEWLKTSYPPVFTNRSGGMEEAAPKDLFAGKDASFYSVVVGEIPVEKPELKADFFGVCGSSGEAEGIARVIFDFEELENVQKGEILVTPNANVAWVSVFPLIKGVITDRGGVLSHAALIASEFGIPAVVNTYVGTQKIKTGQRVRILADEGAVYILG
jgi:phosphohistidine swiveling domain-containing protein